MGSWGFLLIDCLLYEARGLNNKLLDMEMLNIKSYKNAVLYNNQTMLNIKDIQTCIKNSSKSSPVLKNAYTMISMSLYLREEFTYFCNKRIDLPHIRFNTKLNRIKQELFNKIKLQNKIK